jgi:7-cyano-7-deazaguanine synthase
MVLAVPIGEERRPLVLLSGGIDSCVALDLIREQLWQPGQESMPIRTLGFDYGQKHRKKELEAAYQIAQHYGVEHTVVGLPHIFSGAGSQLMDDDVSIDITGGEGPGPLGVVVPFRNGTMISIATALAIGWGCNEIVHAGHADDAKNWAFPDCSPEFFGSMANAVFLGSNLQVRLVTPFAHWTKAAIVRRGWSDNVPLSLTWTCYQGGEQACGQCPACRGRLDAFDKINREDPATYLSDLSTSTF